MSSGGVPVQQATSPLQSLAVVKKTHLAPDVVHLELRDPSGRELPTWRPGAHVDVAVGPDGYRQYSLCGDPGEREAWHIAVLRDDKGVGSAFVHDHVSEGDSIVVGGPRNLFELVPARKYVFIAGGIGVTPIIPMLPAASDLGSDWTLAYGARTSESMIFREEIIERFGDRIQLYPEDRKGLIDLAPLLDSFDKDCLVYCCGPEGLLQAVEKRMRGVWPSHALHVERFSPKAQDEPVRNEEFEIELVRSGITITVSPGRSILETLDAAGVYVLSSCQEGTCGTCEVSVIAGTPQHRDSILTPDERAKNDVMMVCVSRALSQRLVLDI
jgi:ferredoxin-NADP reductase